VDMLLYYCLS